MYHYSKYFLKHTEIDFRIYLLIAAVFCPVFFIAQIEQYQNSETNITVDDFVSDQISSDAESKKVTIYISVDASINAENNISNAILIISRKKSNKKFAQKIQKSKPVAIKITNRPTFINGSSKKLVLKQFYQSDDSFSFSASERKALLIPVNFFPKFIFNNFRDKVSLNGSICKNYKQEFCCNFIFSGSIDSYIFLRPPPSEVLNSA